MKIGTSSYFVNDEAGAFNVGVSRSVPGNPVVSLRGTWKLAAPSAEILSAYKDSDMGPKAQAQYTAGYLARLESNREVVLATFRQIVGEAEEAGASRIVFCCWESKGNFCHRNILATWLITQIRG